MTYLPFFSNPSDRKMAPPRRRVTRSTANNEPPVDPPVMDQAAIEAIINQRVTEALANMTPPVQQPGNTGGNHGNAHPHPGNSRCTYKEFSDCKPRSFHGDGGVIMLAV